ncbi:MAG: GH3 auxin-responsive promoter family protein [Saprospiraceae bacterium]|nr:GH3 auxin-responsive promoter family protein [Saprospiraceae bacterium]
MLYSFFNTLIKGYLKYRNSRIQAMSSTPAQLQKDVFETLLSKLKQTQYGEDFGAKGVRSIADYKKRLPLTQYEALYPYVQKMMEGQEDQLYPGKVLWYAKSSGTTNDKSKFIPITDDVLFENHVAGSWDAMSILYKNRPDTKVFDGKNLIMGGSLTQWSDNVIVGDVSAILLNRMPMVGRPFYTPDFETALMADWEEKIERMAQITSNERVVMFGGVPTWTLVLFKRILEITGKNHMREVWPEVKTYLHGGVGFEPYVNQFKQFLPGDDFDYYEVYNASEGYFAVQDRLGEKGMLLLLDNGIYYEFIPIEQMNDPNPDVLDITDVEVGKDYCIVISTLSGLWRYMPGDVVRFVSTMPYRIMVSGRTKHYINVFGEEVMVHNTDKAIRMACEILDAEVSDYMVAPVFMKDGDKGGHEWWVEFSKAPDNVNDFSKVLDESLRSVNSDYDAKRYKDLALVQLKLNVLPCGTFSNWLKHKGKLGGQSKIPRLSNDRTTAEQIVAFAQSKN